ncbi:MAG: hypothetical protein ABIF19_12925 [Planctomycetota bacterium]
MEINCFMETIKDQLAARDKAAQELSNLQKNLQVAQIELEAVRESLGKVLTRSEEALKSGKALDRIDSKIKELTGRRDLLTERISILHRQAPGGRSYEGLVETANLYLSNTDSRLRAALVRALDGPKAAVADQMSQKFNEGMALFDSYNSDCGALFRDLGVGLTPGSMELAPLPVCSGLYTLLENGFLRGDVVHQPHPPIQPIPEPFGEPEPPEAEPEAPAEPTPGIRSFEEIQQEAELRQETEIQQEAEAATAATPDDSESRDYR